MKTLKLLFDIRSFWHAGSARGGGLALDNMVVKDPDGLPYLPGRSVKGLLRDAMNRAEEWKHLSPGVTETCFGTDMFPDPSGVRPHKNRYQSDPGCLAFGDAVLSDDLRNWLISRDPSPAVHFFRGIHATAVDENGCAREGSLRGYEVTIPMKLTAPVHVLEPSRFPGTRDLEACLPLVGGLGLGRNRGLGRCVVTLEACS